MLLERGEELAAIEARVAEAALGRGSLTLVTGEAGIGKTSLTREAAARLGHAATVWRGACDALSMPRPLSPLYDIARAAGGDLAAVMTSDASRHELFEALLVALATSRHPVLLVIEDAHWADDATLDMVVFIARRVADTRSAVVVTLRDDELDRGHPLTVALGRLASLGTVHRLALGRLRRDSVAALVEGLGLEPDDVLQVTGGNPFFVTEVAAAGTSTPAPATLRDAILARAATLSVDARHALDVSSLFAAPVDPALAVAASGSEPSALDECLAGGLLVAVPGGRLSFRHELARRVIEDAVPAASASALHAAVLRALEVRGGTDVAHLAHHADRAGDRAAAIRYTTRAAERAARVGAHREARRQRERVLDHAEALSHEDLARAWESLADECRATGDETSALAAWDEALALWHERNRVDDQGRVMAQRAATLWSLGRGDEGRALAAEAIELLQDRPASRDLAVAVRLGGQLRMLARDIPGAIALAGWAVDLAERFDDLPLTASALHTLGVAQVFVDTGNGAATLRRAQDLMVRAGNDAGVASVLANMGSGAGEVRAYDVAEPALREAVAWCERRDLDSMGSYAHAWLARIAFERGRWAEARVHAEIARDSSTLISRIVAVTVLARLAVRQGSPRAQRLLDEAHELSLPTNDLQRLWPAAAARAEHAWLQGRAAEIPEMVDVVLSQAIQLHQPWAVGELASWAARGGARITDHVVALAAAPYAAALRGDTAVAAAAWDALGCPWDAALARADSDVPDELLAAAKEFAHLGSRPGTDLVARRLRQHGIRAAPRVARRTTASNPGGLTDRELEVASQLLVGGTNADLAARLHISAKTVDHHVSAILGKLEVATRAEAAAVVASWPTPGERER